MAAKTIMKRIIMATHYRRLFYRGNTSGQFKCICLREYRCKLYSTGFVYIYAGSMQYRVYINGEGGNFSGRT